MYETKVYNPLTPEERRTKLLRITWFAWLVPVIASLLTLIVEYRTGLFYTKGVQDVVILGTVLDSKSHLPIENAVITVEYESKRVVETSNADGKFRLAIQVQDTTQAFDVEVKSFNYREKRMMAKLRVDKPNYMEFSLVPLDKEM